MEQNNWNRLLEEAKKVLNPRMISDYVEAGGVAAAILTESGNVYTGVCIDTACSLGMCAERNAIANMITSGESHIEKLVCIGSEGELMFPCGACREFLMQLGNREVQILTDAETERFVTLGELVPNWWA